MNLDIFMGLTAPVLAYFIFNKNLSNQILIGWNFLGLLLILLIFIIGILSAELPFQQLAFNPPNTTITLFPYILLPSTVVPIVIYMHASEIIPLTQKPS